jgi:hypothetical protein
MYSVDTETSGLPKSSRVNHFPAVITLSSPSTSAHVMF